METTLPKYTPDDIERIFAERVQIHFHTPELKVGTLAEWKFTYPNGNKPHRLNIQQQCTRKITMKKSVDRLLPTESNVHYGKFAANTHWQRTKSCNGIPA